MPAKILNSPSDVDTTLDTLLAWTTVGCVASFGVAWVMFRTSCGQIVKRSSKPSLATLALALGGTLVLAGCDGAEPQSTGPNDEPAPVIATVGANGSASDLNSNSISYPESSEAKAVGPAEGPATVLVLGDSISAAYGIQREKGWVNLLQQYVRRLDEEFRVVNASISGETTGGGLARFAQSLAEHQPKITVIELGGNDGLRGYPLEQVKSNLTQLVQMAKGANSQVLVLGMQIPPNYGARYSNGFAQLFEEVATGEQVPLVPSFLEKIALTPGMLQADGIHPVQAAQPMLLEVVRPELDKLLKELLQ